MTKINLKNDSRELDDLAASHPERLAQMKAKFEAQVAAGRTR